MLTWCCDFVPPCVGPLQMKAAQTLPLRPVSHGMNLPWPLSLIQVFNFPPGFRHSQLSGRSPSTGKTPELWPCPHIVDLFESRQKHFVLLHYISRNIRNSDIPLLPAYSKTGSLSLTHIGWGRAYTGVFSLRPELPNSAAVQRSLIRYAADLQCKPPYHPDGLVPMHHIKPIFPVMDAVPLTFEQRFLYRRYLRQCWHRKGDLARVPIPPAPN